MKKVANSPYLPNAGRAYTNFEGAARFDQDLTKSLTGIFTEFATRLNEVLPKDGSEAMEGDLDLGGFSLINVANITLSGTVTATTINATTGNITTVNATTVNATNGVFSTTLTLGGSTVITAATLPVDVFNGDIFGLNLANNVSDATNDIDIAIGHAASDDTVPFKITLSSGLTKRLDANWAVGTNQGGLDTGSIANTTYFMWLIRRPDTGVVDVLFSASASSPTMPTNYTQKRYIGSIVRSGGTIQAFKQYDDWFEWLVPTTDVTTVTNGVSTLRTLRVPVGRVFRAAYAVRIANTGGPMSGVNHWDPALGSTLPHTYIGYSQMFVNTAATSMASANHFETMTNTSGQIYNRANGIGLSAYEIMTEGWWDTRGK